MNVMNIREGEREDCRAQAITKAMIPTSRLLTTLRPSLRFQRLTAPVLTSNPPSSRSMSVLSSTPLPRGRGGPLTIRGPASRHLSTAARLEGAKKGERNGDEKKGGSGDDSNVFLDNLGKVRDETSDVTLDYYDDDGCGETVLTRRRLA